MRVLLIILGAMIALLALFIGGCSLIFGVTFLVEGDDAYGFWVISAAGVAVAPGLGWIAWLILRAARQTPPVE